MIASLSVHPVGEGASLGRFVRRGVAVIKESGLKYELGSMSTCVEVDDLDVLFDLVKKVHAAHAAEGAQRIIVELKIDDRRDKAATMISKRESANRED